MKWVEALRGKIIGLDTVPLIYFTESNPVYQYIVDPFFEELGRGGFSIVTSILTLHEALVVPLRKGDTLMAQKYREFLFKTANVKTFNVDQVIALYHRTKCSSVERSDSHAITQIQRSHLHVNGYRQGYAHDPQEYGQEAYDHLIS